MLDHTNYYVLKISSHDLAAHECHLLERLEGTGVAPRPFGSWVGPAVKAEAIEVEVVAGLEVGTGTAAGVGARTVGGAAWSACAMEVGKRAHSTSHKEHFMQKFVYMYTRLLVMCDEMW